MHEINAHKKAITKVCTVYHKGSSYVVSSSIDGWVKLWSFPDLVAMHYNGASVTCVSACLGQSVSTGKDVVFIQYGDPDGRLEILEVDLS